MSQAEIVEVLKKFPDRKFSSQELAERLGVTDNSVRRCVNRARRTGLIGFDYVRLRQHRKYLYYWKGE